MCHIFIIFFRGMEPPAALEAPEAIVVIVASVGASEAFVASSAEAIVASAGASAASVASVALVPSSSVASFSLPSFSFLLFSFALGATVYSSALALMELGYVVRGCM